MIISTFIFIFSIIIYFFWSYLKKNEISEFSRLQGGPKPYPIVGNVLTLFNHGLIEGLLSLKDKCSLPSNLWIWNDYYYITDCPHEIKILLSNTDKSFDKAPFYDDLIKVIVGKTFACTPSTQVAKWKIERKALSKTFSPSMWNMYMPVFHKKVGKLLNSLEEIDNFESCLTALYRNSFDIFMENFMGVNTDRLEKGNELFANLTQLTEIPMDRSTLSKLLPQWYYKYFTADGRKFYEMLKFIEQTFKQMIDEKRTELLKKNEISGNFDKPILVESLLLDEISQFNINPYEQIILTYHTSIDTSVLGLAYPLIQLGMNPEIQEKAYSEVFHAVGEYREITTKDLGQLKYLEQCINEALRICLVLPIVGRHITADIKIGKKILPKGANVLIPLYLVHRNEKYWTDPETFDPSRFSPENAKNIAAGSYIPFLMGPRDCLGRYYLMAQLKVLLANILRKYKIKVNPQVAKDMKFKHYIVSKPKDNFKITFIRRCEKENYIPGYN